MLTRCPHCQTAFRITHEQLTPRQGTVRCGSCYQTFNALESLSDEPAVAAVPAPLPPAPPLPDLPEPEPSPWPFPRPEPVKIAGEMPASAPEATVTPEATETVAAPTIPVESILPAEASLPDAWTLPPTPLPPRPAPWWIAALLLLFAAGVQAVYGFRVELAMLMPDLRPPLTALCAQLGCDLPYPRHTDRVAIESSDLAPADPDRLQLTATLKNRATFTQEYPHLELTLTDTRDQALLRKVLRPIDYLPAGSDPARGFAAREDVSISLWLALTDLQPTGYRLYLFYP